jgi:molybdate transport system substrate-binding protein
MTRIALAAAAASMAISFAGPASAAEVTLLCTNALKSVMEELGPQFEKASGNKLHIVFAATNPLKARIEKGESFDAAMLGGGAIDDLLKQGKLAAGSRTDVATSTLGVTIRKGAPKPDIATTEAFKRTMLNAKSLAFNKAGLTADYLKGLFQRLGIAEAMQAKFVDARSAEAVAEGKAEIGITQISEILPIAGAELVGPLPKDIQERTAFPAALSAAAKQPDAAKALLKFLVSPEAAKAIKSKGLEPAA